MAVSKQEVILEFNSDTGGVEKSLLLLGQKLDKLTDSIDDMTTEFIEAGDAAKRAAEATDDIGDAAKDAGKDLKKAGTTGAQSFKALGTAVKATGIGLIVAAVAKLVGKLTENKSIAESLEVAFAAFGVVLNTIVDALTPFADFLFKAFTEPQAALETLRTRLTELGDYLGTLLATAFNPIQKGLLNLKRGFLEAAIGAKEFFGGDATELKKSIREVDDELADLTKQQEENKDALAAPFEAAQDAVESYINRTKDAVKASNDLTQRQQELRDAERDLAVETAQQSANIEELKRQRDDERLSIEERIRLSEEAAAIDQRIADENVRIQEEKAQLIRDEIELQGETEERLQALADAEIAAADARAASAGVQTELMTNIYSLNQEALDIEAEVAALRREFVAENLEGVDAERQALEDQLADRVASIEKLKITEEEKTALILEATASRDEQLEALEAAHQAELDEIAKKAADEAQAKRDKELADEKALREAKVSLALGALGALAALNEAFSKDDEESAKKAFKRNKALSIATAVVNTGQAVVNALTAGGNPIKLATGAQFVEAGIAAAVGAAQVATIGRTKFQAAGGGGGGVDTSVPTPSAGGGGGGTVSVPQLDLGFLGAGAGQQQPLQAYVLAENVSTAQQANQKIQDQATL